MPLPFITLKSIYETAICLGHCLDRSTALDFWHLASQDGFAVVEHEGLKTKRLASSGRSEGIFSPHKPREEHWNHVECSEQRGGVRRGVEMGRSWPGNSQRWRLGFESCFREGKGTEKSGPAN